MSRILVVDDDRAVLHMVKQALEPKGLDVLTAASAAEAYDQVRAQKPDVVLLDVILPESSGLDVLRDLREVDRRMPVIFITAGGDSTVAIDAMQMGAFDYVAKPLDLPKLADLITKALDTRRLMSVPVAVGVPEEADQLGDQFIGRSPRMLEVFKAIGRVASQNVTVLIRGESGTGKELVARAIYQHSRRSDEPFMAVNCAALPDTLLESELFGHEKGSFTGADRRRIGKFEQCNGGTIFLDEVGDMSPLVQGKVLRILQEQRFERVGGNETITTDVRIIAATNRNLDEMVEEGDFRSDLLYRINGVTISLPPLRDRTDDIRPLLEYFLSRARTELEKPDVEGISPDALEILLNYHWPGNVRELQSVVRRAVLNATGPVIVPAFLPEEVTSQTRPTASLAAAPHPPAADLPISDLAPFVEQRLAAGTDDLYNEALAAMERFVITRVLKATDGNQSKASRILGITRAKIRDRIAAYGITLDKQVTIESR